MKKLLVLLSFLILPLLVSADNPFWKTIFNRYHNTDSTSLQVDSNGTVKAKITYSKGFWNFISKSGIKVNGVVPASFDTSANHNNLYLNQITSRTAFKLIIPSASKTIGASSDSMTSIAPDGTVKQRPTKTISSYFTNHTLTIGSVIKTTIDSTYIEIDSAKVYRASSNIADDGTITFSLAKSGRGWVSAGDDEARTWFYFKADGTITLGSSDVINAANTDLDTYLCVYDNTGNSFIIKNRLGGSKVITYEIIVGK